MTTVTLISGDGIGPEIVASVKTIFTAAGVPIQWEEENAGATTLAEKGELIPKSLIESINKNKIALKAPITTPVGTGFRSVNVALRQEFDLYINLRPAQTIEGIKTRFENVDIHLFRENTEGLYAGLEMWDEANQIGDSVKRVTRKGCERIIRAAFEYAKKHNRKKVSLVHKANILKVTMGLFLNVGKEIAKEYPEIQCNDVIIDNCCMQLVVKPEQFDVIVTTNLFGDILSDLLAGMVGGLGVVPGANIGSEIAIFEAVHGTAPDIAGKGIANPTALLRSAIMMLRHMGLNDYANNIEIALFNCLKEPSLRTGDLGGKCNTQQFTQNVVNELAKIMVKTN